MRAIRFAFLVMIFAATTVTASAAELTPEMLVDLRTVRDVALAPDATHVAYTLDVPRATDDEPGTSYRELWVTRPDRLPRKFAGEKERISHPQWSPDGKRLAFLSNRGDNDRTELFVLASDGGEATRLFEHEGSIAAFRWSGDGKTIAFVARDPQTPDEKEDDEAGRDWQVADENYKYRRPWLHDLRSGSTRPLWSDPDRDLDVIEMDWTNDGGTMVLVAADTPRVDDEYMFSSLYRLRMADGTLEKIADTPGKLEQIAVGPDGRTLAFLGAVSQNDPLAQSLFVVPISGGPVRNLTPDVESSAARVAWWDDEHLLLISVEREQHVLQLVHRNTGESQPLEWPRLVVSAIAGSSGRFVVIADGPEHPRELFLFEGGTAWRRLTDSNPGLADVGLARQEVIEWEGADGWDISGVLTYPLDYREGRRYPLVLQIHGGPEGVSLDGWTTSPGYPVQPLAARGYMVLQPNYRGSQGRGIAFSKSDHDDLGGKEFDDVLAGVDALIRRGLVDGSRVGTGGWSYGGYFSAWAATRHSERFRASVVAAGLTNWTSFAGTTDIPYEMSLVHWNSWWFDEPELHWQRSPVAHIRNARTPTLIVHGDRDARVHPEQALQLYTALRIKKVPTQYVLYPREPHGLEERAHRLDFVERVLDWFDRHLAPDNGN